MGLILHLLNSFDAVLILLSRLLYFSVFWSATLTSKRRVGVIHGLLGLWCLAIWPGWCGAGLVFGSIQGAAPSGWVFALGVLLVTATLTCMACRSWLPGAGLGIASIVLFVPLMLLQFGTSALTVPTPPWILALLVLSWHLITGAGLFLWAVRERRKPLTFQTCSRCGYDLRGLGGRPCPECGGARGHWPDSPSDGGTG